MKTNLRHAASVTCCICTFLFPNKSSAVAEMGDRSATIDIGRKERAAACMLSSGVAGSRVEVYLRTKWHDLDPSLPFGHKGMGRKVGVLCPFLGGAGSPSNNTMSPGPRHISIPSGILIHPTVWSQYTNVTDRQDRVDKQTQQWSDIIGRTVLQTVAQ